MDKICNYIEVGILDVIIPHEIAEILINLIKVMFRTTRPVTIYMISIKLYFLTRNGSNFRYYTMHINT
jgi:sulfopyruvate decarboxylase TPP-binding subunit